MSAFDLAGTLFMGAIFGLFYLIGYHHGWRSGWKAKIKPRRVERQPFQIPTD